MSEVLLFCDLDGTLTDGVYETSDSGHISKNFHTRDIDALYRLSNLGIKVFIVTGSENKCNRMKFENTDIPLYENVQDKANFVKSICANFGVEPKDCIFIGDGQNDYDAMMLCGIKACPKDASPIILEIDDIIIAERCGGHGAVEEILIDLFS